MGYKLLPPRSRPLIALLVLLGLVATMPPAVVGETFNVTNLDDLWNAIQNAGDGDVIQFTAPGYYNLSELPAYNNDNGNGMFVEKDAFTLNWRVENISITLTAAAPGQVVLGGYPGQNPTIEVQGARRFRVEGLVLEVKLDVENTGDVSIRSCTFRAPLQGTPLYVFDNAGFFYDSGGVTGSVVIEDNYFEIGRENTFGPWLHFVRNLIVRDNAFNISYSADTVEKSGLLLSVVQNASVTGNQFTLNMGSGTSGTGAYIYAVELNDYPPNEGTYGIINLTIANNVFRALPEPAATSNTKDHHTFIYGKLSNMSHVGIYNNTFKNEGGTGFVTGGISISKPSLATLKPREIEVRGNTFDSLTGGVSLSSSEDTMIVLNTFTSLGGEAVSISYTSPAIVANNTLGGKVYLRVGLSQWVAVKYNNFTTASRPAVAVEVDRGTVEVIGNLFPSEATSTTTAAVEVESATRVSRVTIAYNVFNAPLPISLAIDGEYHVYMNAFNFNPGDEPCPLMRIAWASNVTLNSTTPIYYVYGGVERNGVVGNYYQWVTGPDANNDGILETTVPYCIVESRVEMEDTRPLASMEPILAHLGLSTPPSTGGETGTPPGASEEEGEAAPPAEPPLRGEELKTFLKAQDQLMEAREELDAVLEQAGITVPVQADNITVSGDVAASLRQALEQANLTKVFNDLVDKGLVKKPPKLSPGFTAQLWATLARIYGPGLEDFPTPMGRLYLLELIASSGEE